MKKDLIIIPKENFLLGVLSYIEKGVWIFVHKNFIDNLKACDDVDIRENYELDGYIISWKENGTDKIMEVSKNFSNYVLITSVDTVTSNWRVSKEPEKIVFLKIEE